MNQARILVVDDEPDIRELVCEILQDEGYDVYGGGGWRSGPCCLCPQPRT